MQLCFRQRNLLSFAPEHANSQHIFSLQVRKQQIHLLCQCLTFNWLLTSFILFWVHQLQFQQRDLGGEGLDGDKGTWEVLDGNGRAGGRVWMGMCVLGGRVWVGVEPVSTLSGHVGSSSASPILCMPPALPQYTLRPHKEHTAPRHPDVPQHTQQSGPTQRVTSRLLPELTPCCRTHASLLRPHA